MPQPALPGFVDPIAETLAALRRKGFGRLLVNGDTVQLEDVDPATLKDQSTLKVIVDRLKVDGDLRARLTDSIETAYTEGGGAAFAIQQTDGEPIVHRFSERFECRACNIQYEIPQPRLFSFNNPFGACPTCHGFGNIIELDMDLVVPDRVEVDPAERDRTVEQAALPCAARRAEARGQDARHSPGRAVVGADRRRAPVHHRWRWRGVRRGQGFLPLARTQEIQGARSRISQPLSRVPDVPGVPGRAAAA